MTGRGAHRTATFALCLLMTGLGAGIIGEVIAGYGSAISARLLLGALFIAAGLGRGYLEIRRGRGA